MSKHTPGPWFVGEREHCIVLGSPQGLVLFRASEHTPLTDDDARLIAAAPTLLKALQELYTLCHGSVIAVQMDQARAAIAKATGEQP